MTSPTYTPEEVIDFLAEGVMDADEAAVYVLEALRTLKASGDPEAAHSRADSLLCGLLTRMGFEEVVGAWQEVPRWYA